MSAELTFSLISTKEWMRGHMQNQLTWYCSQLEIEQVAAGEIRGRQDAFSEVFRAAGGPREMALFQKARDDGGIYLFLTPVCGQFAAELLNEWESVPCDRPSAVGLELLVGHNEITYYMP